MDRRDPQEYGPARHLSLLENGFRAVSFLQLSLWPSGSVNKCVWGVGGTNNLAKLEPSFY
jgi:hypothetical protein